MYLTPQEHLKAATVRYCSPDRPTIKSCHIELQSNLANENWQRREAGLPVLTCPSYDQLKREIRRLNPAEVAAGRFRLAYARRRYAAMGGLR